MKHVSIVTPCYNEEANVGPLHDAVRAIFAQLPQYTYEHVFIDNASRDGTAKKLRELAAANPNVKVILNARNFGHIRSPYHGLLQATGDAVITLVADFQDPPDLIPVFLSHWEAGHKVVIGVKEASGESPLMWAVRGLYYRIVRRLASVDLVKQFTGFGLYDRQVIDVFRRIDDPYPYFRGLVAEVGFDAVRVSYKQPPRRRGITSNNFYTLYDLAMLGVVNHSRVPLRVATMAGFAMSAASLLLAFGYLVAKLVFWDWLSAGIAPLLITLFFFSSVQLFFTGILGEYIGAILTQVQKRPLVVEKERINFGPPPPSPERNGVHHASTAEVCR